MALLDELGGPAFPILDTGNGSPFYNGMTLHDYFAAKAMQAAITGLVASGQYGNIDKPDVALFAQEMADAMLEARGD